MTVQPLHRKEIIFDRALCDYALYLDGELVGFARDHVQGEITLNALILEQLLDGQTLDARIEQLAQQYSDARATGDHIAARTIKQAAMDLTARKLGITPSEFVAGYAAWKAA